MRRLLEELLNETLFRSPPQARDALDAWRNDYNQRRPHSRLGWMTPQAYAATVDPRPDRPASLPDGFAVRPVAQPAHLGLTEHRIPVPSG
ncbi:MAG: transposase [Alphaproteobacteria bacterium]|nr:transposase [Alphaproteobacteria bacterium]